MSKKLVSSAFALALVAAPLSASAGMGADETFNIYGWQNWSYEFIDADGGKDYDRLSNNAANIGFMAHIDTGIEGLQAGFRCEQFTFFGRNNNYPLRSSLCNRNSKLSLRHETLGEVMFGQWLMPYNEIVAQWIDPFYDADINSHTSIMGHIGGNGLGQLFDSLYYNGSFGNYGALSFNRRQNGIIQYVWPNTSAMGSQSRDGVQFRFAVTEGSDTDQAGRKRFKLDDQGAVINDREAQHKLNEQTDLYELITVDVAQTETTGTLDPRIWSTGVAWQQGFANGGRVWLAVAYEKHDDVTVAGAGNITSGLIGSDSEFDGAAFNTRDYADTCSESDDDGLRLAARYSHDWGNGQMTMIAGMYEELSYEMEGCDFSVDEKALPSSVDIERDSWMVSGKHAFGNGVDFRFSYMDADELECGSGTLCPGGENNTDADAYNLGLFYTMPAGTELRVVYGEVDNEANSHYDLGIFGGGSQVGEDIEAITVGVVQWFD